MKKRLLVTALAIFCALVLPITAYARKYNIPGTDLSIKIDDTCWYVFTRENIANNSELAELDLTYDEMYDILHNNKAYVDAMLFYEDGKILELFICKTSSDSTKSIGNLSKHDDDDILLLAKKWANKNNVDEYSVYKSEYKFMRVEYSVSGCYICDFGTTINVESYTFKFQSSKPFTHEDYAEIEDIIDSAHFNVDETPKNNNSISILDGLLDKFIGGVVIAAIVGLPSLFFHQKKRKSDQQ